MSAFLLCMVFCKCTFNWQVYLIQPLSKLNDFQNRHLAVLFMKVITLYKAPLLKNALLYRWTFSFEICTESSYLLCIITESKIIMETNKKQVAFSTVQKLSSKTAKIFGGILFTPLLSPLCKFLLGLYIDTESSTLKECVMSVRYENSAAYQYK